MRITASTIKQFLRALPADRRRTVEAMRTVILENIDTPFAEVVQNGAIGYVVPHSVYPAGYHCDPSQPLPFAGTAAQKHHIGLYPFCIYGDPKFEEWFRAAWLKAGKKLDMGKSCVRVKTLDDVPLEVAGKLFKRVKAKKLIAVYEAAVPPSARRAPQEGEDRETLSHEANRRKEARDKADLGAPPRTPAATRRASSARSGAAGRAGARPGHADP